MILLLIALIVAWSVGVSASAAEAAKDAAEDTGKKTIEGKEYKLAWSDEFDGLKLDEEKWRHRLPSGYGFGDSLITTDATYADGKGHLVVTMCALTKAEVAARVTAKEEKDALAKLPDSAWIPAISSIITRRAFLFGYHEIRFKLPLIPGPGLDFWFITHKDEATEIDVLEQTLYHQGNLIDCKSSTIHWYPGGYKPENRQHLSYEFIRPKADGASVGRSHLGQGDRPYKPELPRVVDLSTNGRLRKTYCVKDDYFRWDDGQFHTVALLWTPERYSFYYDGQKVCTFEAGIPNLPVPALLDVRIRDSLEKLGQSPGRNNPRETPAKVLVDYYRVYEAAAK